MNGGDHRPQGPDASALAFAPAGLDESMAALLSGMRDCACGLDHAWRIKWANERAARHVGVDLVGALGRVLWDLFPHAVGTHLEALFRRAIAEKKPQWANLLSPITQRWVEMRVFPTSDGVVLLWSDLTERQEEERAKRRAAEERDAALVQLEAVLNLLPVGVAISRRRDGGKRVYNRAFVRMLMGDAEPSAGAPVADVDFTVLRDGVRIPADELPVPVAARTGLLVPPTEYTIVRADGSRIVVTAAALPLLDAEGRAMGAAACFTDVTDLEAALSAVEEHASFLAALGDTVPGLLWAADAAGRLEYGNRAIETYFGCPPAELRVDVWWEACHPDHAAAVSAAWERAAALVEPLELEYPLRRADGEYRWFLVRATPHADGGVRRWIGIALDVTERTRAEEQLRDTQRLQAVGKLAGGVAHEVNNQMTVVLGMAALASKRLGADHPAQAAIERISSAGERAATITRQLLAFSRRQVLQPVLLDLNDVLTAFQPVLERIVGASTSVELHLSPSRPAVRADRDQLEQVLVNLASNSRDAMPGGGRLVVRTGALTDAEVRRAVGAEAVRPGPWVFVSVADTGIGMTREVRARAFEPFYSTRPRGEGTGLGLATVYGIVTQSGGLLALETEPAAGTTLTLFLPAAEAPGEAERPAEAAIARPSPSHAGERRKGRVLVVEDEVGVRELVCEVLADAGFDVLAAASGDEALQLAAGLPEPPLLLLTDVVMPGMGGRELATRVQERWPVPVLYVSGYAWDEVVRRGLLEERVPFLQKPFLPDALLGEVRSVVRVEAPST